jgi:hypothetical protein
MKRALIDAPYVTHYELKFQNGAISEPKTLNEVFDGENWGSTAIRRVSVDFQDTELDPKTRIGIRFSDPHDSDTKNSITYAINGEDRDWVFVASSQLSERITRVERFDFRRILSSRAFPLLVMMLFLVGMMAWMSISTSTDFQTRSALVKQLRHEWSAGTLHDPVDVVLRIEEANDSDPDMDRFFRHFVWTSGSLMVACIALLFAAQPILNYCFPPYNFVWGEYQREYEKRKGRVRFILVGVVLTIFLGVLVNFVSKRFGL